MPTPPNSEYEVAPDQKRFWVYVHDLDGEITKDCGDFDKYADAFDKASHTLYFRMNPYETPGDGEVKVIRIIDNEVQGGSTVWIAGPMKYIKENIEASRG